MRGKQIKGKRVISYPVEKLDCIFCKGDTCRITDDPSECPRIKTEEPEEDACSK